ncbi:MAG TPA: hypothetical protein VH142_04120 [Polyangiaceae bacterium]|nr:hypothetical protein [Polyangiaceae bacterium]
MLLTLRAPCLLLLAALAGCSTIEPDVVAVQKKATPNRPEAGPSFFNDDAGIEPCRAGNYTGAFGSQTVVDGGVGLNLPFEGTIKFALVSSVVGEFSRIQDHGLLNGTSGNSKFTAKVLGEAACQYATGDFNTTLSDGVFDLYGNGSLDVDFVGTVTGKYLPDADTFVGSWSAYVKTPPTDGSASANTVPVSQGWWLAHIGGY